LLSADKALDIQLQLRPIPVWVKADALSLDRLLLISCDNAIKYTPRGGRCEIALSQDQRQCANHSHGFRHRIGKEDLQHVFDRFLPRGSCAFRKYSRCRLGACDPSMDYGSAWGNIAVESTPGAGSAFRISCLWRRELSRYRNDLSEKSSGSFYRLLKIRSHRHCRFGFTLLSTAGVFKLRRRKCSRNCSISLG